MNSRRDFLKKTGCGIALGSMVGASRLLAQAGSASGRSGAIRLGVASYSLRKFKVADALDMTKRLGISRIVFKDVHLPLTASDAEIRQTIDVAKSKGVEVYGCGAVYMKTEAEVDQAFHYAKTAGMEMIIGVPSIPLLPHVERKVKETGVIMAIHNHGPDNPLYASPLEAYELVKGMDKRMGVCVDIGHTTRLGEDPIAVFKKVFDRAYDVHIKDVTSASKAGTTCEIGNGVIDVIGFLKAAVALKYAGTLGFEFEPDPDDPLPRMAQSVGYVRGVLKLLA